MATGASTADLSIILIDARRGVLPQTRRHAFICSLLGIKHVVIAINKMDLVDYDEAVFQRIRSDCVDFLTKLPVVDLHFIPMCARRGENVVGRAETMPWYGGGPLLDYLENVHIASDRNMIDFRLPVQVVLRPNLDFRGFAGTIASGVLRVGDEVVALPSGRRSTVKTITSAAAPREEAFAGMAVTITLDTEIDVSRGDTFVRPNNAPPLDNAVEAMVVWMNETALEPGRSYMLQQAATLAPATVTHLRYRMNIETLRSESAERLKLNEIGRVRIESSRLLAADPYAKNRHTGAFILVDRMTNATLAAGMILDRTPAERALEAEHRSREGGQAPTSESAIGPEQRAKRVGQKPFAVWLTGLPHSGKSSVAYALERALFERGCHALVLDGELLRAGLSSDLGFSAEDRIEHTRRAAELMRLFLDQGLIVIGAFVSPTTQLRDQARGIVGAGRFIEVHCDAPLEICEARDVEKLFERARRGEIANVAGVDQAYEAPPQPDVRLDTGKLGVERNVARVLDLLGQRGWLALS